MASQLNAEIGPDKKSAPGLVEESSKDGLHTAVAENNSVQSVEGKDASLWRRIMGVVWDSLQGEPEYRQYVQKLDRVFL